jgi:hypothetical protein
VLAVAGRLWPDHRVRLVRRPGGAPPGARDLLVVPLLRRPRLLLPADSAVSAAALVRNDAGQRRPRAWRLLARMQRRRLLRHLPLPRLRMTPVDSAGSIGHELQRVLGTECEVVVRLGRRRANRSVVLRPLSRDGSTLAFVKCAYDPSGVQALHRERDNLEAAARLGRPDLVAPRVLHHGSWRGIEMLAVVPLVGHHDGDVGPDAAVPVDAMRGLARARGVEVLALADTTLMRGLDQELAALRPSQDRDRLRSAGGAVRSWLGDVTLPVGCWHGDWTPWNMATDRGRVLLWDWEHFAEGVPLGFDPLHYRAQQLRVVAGTGRAVEQRWVEEATAVLASEPGLAAEVPRATILAYLLEINLRFLRDRDAEPATLPTRRGWGIPLTERLLRQWCG